MDNFKLAGAAFAAAVAVFLLSNGIALYLSPSFNLASTPFSNLGYGGGSAGTIWDAGMFLFGLLVLVGGLLYFDYGKDGKIMMATYLAGGICFIAIPMFGGGSSAQSAGTSVLVALALAGVFTSVSFRMIYGRLRYFTLCLGILSLLGTADIAAIALGTGVKIGESTLELISICPVLLWLLILSFDAMRSSRS